MKNKLPGFAINITAACNLNCNGCYVGSNFEYKGHSSWKEQQSIYKKWSKKIDIQLFEIYGGEPFLNPEWYEWYTGVMELWPNAVGQFTTNGYALTEKNKKLYDLLRDSNGQHHLEVSHHNKDKLDWLWNRIENFLEGKIKVEHINDKAHIGPEWDHLSLREKIELPVLRNLSDSYNKVKDSTWPDVNSIADWKALPDWIVKECDEVHGFSMSSIENDCLNWKLVDENDVTVVIRNDAWFMEGPVSILDDQKGLAFHDSDAQKAHDCCPNKQCREIYNGKIHKCNSVGHFKEWTEQFPMELTDRQKELIDSYQPLAVDASHEEIDRWWAETWNNPIPQCALCPESRKPFEVNATTKKIKFVR